LRPDVAPAYLKVTIARRVGRGAAPIITAAACCQTPCAQARLHPFCAAADPGHIASRYRCSSRYRFRSNIQAADNGSRKGPRAKGNGSFVLLRITDHNERPVPVPPDADLRVLLPEGDQFTVLQEKLAADGARVSGITWRRRPSGTAGRALVISLPR
jgi:hypothetical protein